MQHCSNSTRREAGRCRDDELRDRARRRPKPRPAHLQSNNGTFFPLISTRSRKASHRARGKRQQLFTTGIASVAQAWRQDRVYLQIRQPGRRVWRRREQVSRLFHRRRPLRLICHHHHPLRLRMTSSRRRRRRLLRQMTLIRHPLGVLTGIRLHRHRHHLQRKVEKAI